MRKSTIYSLIGLVLWFGFIIFWIDWGSNSEELTTLCENNGFERWSRNPETDSALTEVNGIIYVSCQQKNVVNGKLEINNEWIETDLEPENSLIKYSPIIIFGLLVLVFEVYALKKDEWN